MPAPDGVDTLVQLKEIFEKRKIDVTVVCHTTEEGRDNINLYKAAGFADVLIKPIDPKQLSSILMTYLPEEDKVSDEEEKLLLEEKERDDTIQEDEVKDELDKLPVWIKSVPHIDLVAGIANCDTAEDYIDALYIFYSSIEDKAEDIQFFLEMEDWIMYGLRVHSLKSVAALVGARDLSEKAAAMEAATRDEDYTTIVAETPDLLDMYRGFAERLAPLKDIRDLFVNDKKSPAHASQREENVGNSKTILFIHAEQGIVPKGIDNNLKKAGFKVLSIPDEPDLIITYRFEADIVLYLPCEGKDSHIGLTMNLLGEICQDDSKILCLIGDPRDIEIAMDKTGSLRVSHCYPRPLPA